MVSLGSNVTSYTLSPIVFGIDHNIGVIATNNNTHPYVYRDPAYTNFLKTGLTPISPLSNLNVSVIATNEAILIWADAAGEDGYLIFTNGQGPANILMNIGANVGRR